MKMDALEKLFEEPPLATLPDEVGDLRDTADAHFKDFRVLETSDTSFGPTVDLFAVCRRCSDGLHYAGRTLHEALCLMLAGITRDCPRVRE
jgi:hypothetical protein